MMHDIFPSQEFLQNELEKMLIQLEGLIKQKFSLSTNPYGTVMVTISKDKKKICIDVFEKRFLSRIHKEKATEVVNYFAALKISGDAVVTKAPHDCPYNRLTRITFDKTKCHEAIQSLEKDLLQALSPAYRANL